MAYTSTVSTAWDVNGVDGAIGPEGGEGPTGSTGATGATGPQGIAGTVGATGPTGQYGPAGPQGATGNTGPQGIAGTVGATGPQGIDGVAGAVGSTGPQGVDGPAGAVGSTGPQGINGVAGATGPQGSTGPAGSAADETKTQNILDRLAVLETQMVERQTMGTVDFILTESTLADNSALFIFANGVRVDYTDAEALIGRQFTIGIDETVYTVVSTVGDYSDPDYYKYKVVTENSVGATVPRNIYLI